MTEGKLACPNCNKPESVAEHSPTWVHGIACCSHDCSYAVKLLLEKNKKTEAYRAAATAYAAAKEAFLDAKYAGIPPINRPTK